MKNVIKFTVDNFQHFNSFFSRHNSFFFAICCIGRGRWYNVVSVVHPSMMLRVARSNWAVLPCETWEWCGSICAGDWGSCWAGWMIVKIVNVESQRKFGFDSWDMLMEVFFGDSWWHGSSWFLCIEISRKRSTCTLKRSSAGTWLGRNGRWPWLWPFNQISRFLRGIMQKSMKPSKEEEHILRTSLGTWLARPTWF